ncbi:MAG: response regulator transcription factor [Cellvibrionaceae bacterium]|nr:response regulator transcription factor [Cellvibrionaceae bacterium]
MNNKAIKILVADDHKILMDGLVSALAGAAFEVVAMVRNPEEVLPAYMESAPDVVISDMKFNDREMTGLDVIEQITDRDSHAKIIIFSQYDSIELIRSAYALGAKAFVTKSMDIDLNNVIQEVYSGSVFFEPSVSERLAKYAIQGTASPRDVLNDRELSILCLLAKGCTQKEIAEQMHLSLRTVNSVHAAIREKLQIERPSHLTLLAVQYNLIQVDSLTQF